MTDLATQRQMIRQQMRQARNALSLPEQQQAAQALIAQTQTLAQWQEAQFIAMYLSFQGEINTQPLIEHLWQQGKTVLVPVLHPFSKGHLLFLRYTPTSKMTLNKYQISEPVLDQTQIVPLEHIDIIATPLVAFDCQGNRLGMGGGYYDRTLAICADHKDKKPFVIGLAHDLQQVDKLPIEQWDQPLNTIITPKKIWHWENSKN